VKKVDDLRVEAQRCVGIANQSADNKVAAAFLAYACELEQRARLIEVTTNAPETAIGPAERRSV
jgi:hypothetical protein